MTTTENPTDATTDTPEAPETEAAPEAEAAPKGNREARYRVERNEAREERDAALATVTSLQTRELHRIAGELLAQPEDIGLSGKELADFLTPEGWLDREAVAEAAAEIIDSRPGLAKHPKVLAVDSTQGQGGSGKPKAPQWADLFRD
jgi:hypothetical protein